MLTFAGVFSLSSLLLVDSAIKGAALLTLAAIAAMLLRRDSAATRHLVWLLAMIAMIAVPVMSALLPQWRVLPQWASVAPASAVVAKSPPSVASPGASAGYPPQIAEPDEAAPPNAAAVQPAAALPQTRPALMPADAPPAPDAGGWNWLGALPLAWAIGFCVLILRLMAARWMLWNSERQATIIGSSGQENPKHDPIVTALDAVCLQLGITRPVTLLMHPDKTIPVVWGILRYRLMLPLAARQWSGEQLQSVLLHELAHVKRRDTLAQLLTQFACALHWFNPLVWFAAWRLGVERERACDDLVLASGVRPSAYAGHLLDVVTALSPSRWTQSCGLAMARKSSLESRLAAVLSQNLNRRRVSVVLAASALAIAAAIAIPLAMLGAMDEKSGEIQKPATTDMKPKHEYAQALFKKWQANARTDGKIPGALIGHLAREIDSFLKQYPKDEKAPSLAALRPRLDASHDWTQADVVALLDEITAISTAPVSWADTPLEFDAMRKLRPGQPLPAELKTAAWGVAAANGLRAAWLLEPNAKQYALGTVLKARVLFHNSGKEPVIFKTETWHQYDPHTARDAKGLEIRVSGPRYTGITPMATYRLAPGEFCEVRGHGVAIGAGKYEEEFSTGSVGAVIEAKEGDEVTLTHSVDTTYGGWTRPTDPKDPAELWKLSIAERVEREAPMPKAAADREQLIRRVTLDVFGLAASAEEIAAFVADNAADALEKLTMRLQAKPRVEPWAGKLPTGETKFRVTAADPNAAKPPRTANAPGRYVLDDNVHLLVSQVNEGGKRTNMARIAFLSPDPKVASPHKPYEIALPDGIGAYGIVWQRGAGELWVMQKGLVRKHNFSDPAKVKETRFEPGSIDDVPQPLRDALRKVFEVPGAQQKESQNPKSKEAQALFKMWQNNARKNGDIPGGLIGRLEDKVKEFIRNNTGDAGGDSYAKKMAPLLPRFDATRDWKQADVVALLDDIAAVTTIPLEVMMWEAGDRTIKKGTPLPKELASASWGEPQAGGLRMAWLLEPRAKEYHLGTPLKSRILFHNSGKNAVVFRTRTWHQSADHQASDAKGAQIKVDSTYWTTLPRLVTFRLAPGEYVEVIAAGIGVGANKNDEDWQNTRVGAWIDATAGDEVTFQPDAVPCNDWNELPAKKGSDWWLAFITARLASELPLPAAADERTALLGRVVRDLFGNAPTAEETAAFANDRNANALDSLAKRLAQRPGQTPFSGPITSATTKFRVLPPDPDAAIKPRTAANPGRYTLGDYARLVVSRRPDGERIVNEASIEFYSSDPKKPAPGKAHEIKLPDGYNTWAAAWERGGTVVWVLQKGTLTSYDFTNPAKVTETTVKDSGNSQGVPQPILDALRAALEISMTPKSATDTPKKQGNI